MKTKLLRKVRKRYSISWYPEREKFELLDRGKVVGNQSLHKLNIHSQSCFPQWIPCTKEEAYDQILHTLWYVIRAKYGKFGTRRIAVFKAKQLKMNTKEKVWYV